MKNKKMKITLFSLSFLLSSVAGASLAIGVQSTILNQNSIGKSKNSLQADQINDLIPSENNDQNANLSTTAGPLTFWGNTITALDWYGAKLWQLDMTTVFKGNKDQTTNNSYIGSWKRAWYNWDYNRTTNTIWVLGYYRTDKSMQQLVAINANDGTITKTIDLGNTKGYRFVTALASGNVMVYGGAGTAYDATASLYNASTGSVAKIHGDSSSKDYMPSDKGKNYKWYFFNLIPVAKGKNMVELVAFDNGWGTTGDQSANNASYDVYMLLVDDNLNFIGKNTSEWSKPVKIAEGLEGYRNTTVTPQRDYYTMLNGGVVTVVYNNVVILNVSGEKISLSKFSMSGENTDSKDKKVSKWIKSWAFDSNENLYFKFKDSVKIYKVESDAIKKVTQDSTVTPVTYLDLSSIEAELSPYASSYSIYNVYGYTGQLMLINSKYNAQVTSTSALTPETNSLNYGLAIAITQNATAQNTGDCKGLLNTSDSFQKSADFTINQSVLDSKIPSEITKNDLTMLNDAFLQEDRGYVPFTISNIDDSKKTFQVICNLFKVPWFADRLPNNAIPKTVTKTFTTKNEISNKTSWKILSTSSDYDFMNMLPSTIQTTDVENLDPFQVSFQSQTIVDKEGKTLYPKKTYTTKEANDSEGTITIEVKYEYVPMGVTYTDGKNDQVLTYSTSKKYNTYKSSETSAFYFIGSTQANADSQTVNVKQIQQLKNLLEANTLPSSFSNLSSSSDKSNSGFLQFINTTTSKGYPISKMNFTVDANDSKGELKITAKISSQYSPDKKDHSFTITYTGMNQGSEYNFSFNKNVSKIGTQNFNTLLPSSINNGDVINNLIDSKGFDTNDFTINLIPDDVKGTLQVDVKLKSTYAEVIGKSGHGFNDYSTSYTYNGFMTKTDYNNRYNVSFVGDDDSSLIDLKIKQVEEISKALTGDSPSGLTIGSTKYANLNEFIDKVLIKSRGAMIPINWKDKTDIKSSMYYDNSLGTASFFVTIPKSLLSGADSDLNLVVNYTGFVQGNVDNTSDNLSFVSDAMLKNYLISKKLFLESEFKSLTPTKFAEWVNTNNHINDLITYKTGQYNTKLANKDYKLSVVANDNQNTVSIIINFGQMTDSKSLSEYSIQYTI